MTVCRCTSHNGFLTERGYAEFAQRERERNEFDAMQAKLYLDRECSVSALVEVEDDSEYDPLHVELNSTFLQLESF